MDKIEKIIRKGFKTSAKNKNICNSHNVIFVKKLNKLDKELDYIANKLRQETEILKYKSSISTIAKISNILDNIKKLKSEIKNEKRNLDLNNDKKFVYPKRKALIKTESNSLEDILREFSFYLSRDVEIPY